jgi:CBS domain-containing protein
MGEQNVSQQTDEKQQRKFMRALLSDVWALEQMLSSNRIESGVRRIGAEQEMFLVMPDMRPAPIVSAILATLQDSRFTTELAKFNLEANMPPRVFEGSCLRTLEEDLQAVVQKAADAAAGHGAKVLLTGILPTLTLKDLNLSNMTEVPRYFELNRTLCELRRSKFYVHIKGLDEIHLTHDNMMLEACNTSFQLHIQTDPDEFVDQYNIAQAVAAPVLAAAVNSPLLFGQRLWAETRIALLQHSIDERSEVQHARYRSPRVSFGERWLKKSVMEIFREDIARFRVILTHKLDEDPAAVLNRGETPLLSALRLHNGTVWRWNRACYGIINGIPHLRIEHRALPAGPTVVDEVANAAFFLGLMSSVKDEYGPIDRLMEFDHTKANFYSAARHGLNAQLEWVEGSTLPAGELIVKHLLPLARKGLKKNRVAPEDIDRYLGIIEKRVSSRHTGARWMTRSLSVLAEHGTRDRQLQTLTALMHKAETNQEPVHTWYLPKSQELGQIPEDYNTVRQVMSTRLFTVRPNDIADYVASIMHWERLRHVPVEDDEGRLVGIVSQRHLLLLLAQGSVLNRAQDVQVQTIMQRDPITVTPQTPTLEAIELLKTKQIGCLPVIEDGKLVGIVTLFDLLTVSSKLLENRLRSQ